MHAPRAALKRIHKACSSHLRVAPISNCAREHVRCARPRFPATEPPHKFDVFAMWSGVTLRQIKNEARQQRTILENVMAKRKRRYSRSSGKDVKSEMHRYKRGTARSGRGGKPSQSVCRKRARKARKSRDARPRDFALERGGWCWNRRRSSVLFALDPSGRTRGHAFRRAGVHLSGSSQEKIRTEQKRWSPPQSGGQPMTRTNPRLVLYCASHR